MKEFNVEGAYTFLARDIRTGEEQNLGTYHNIPCNYFYNLLSQDRHTSLYGDNYFLKKLLLGSGSAEPSATDTALTSQLFSVEFSEVTDQVMGADLLSAGFTLKAVIPASSSYVGSIREVGIQSSNNQLCTHALLKDAEGQPITIEKTEIMQLTVLCTLTFTVTDAPARFSVLPFFKYRLEDPTPYHIAYSGGGTGNYVNMQICSNRKEYLRVVDGKQIVYSPRSIFSKNISNLPNTWNATTRKTTISGCRILATEGNTHYVHQIRIGGKLFCGISFPNATYFPLQVLADLPVGTGDGSNTDFNPPLAFWVKDTEEIFIDGVRQVRGVDYTCDYYNNLADLEELYPSNAALVIGGHPNTGYNYCRFYKSDNTADFEPSYSVTIKPEKPLIVELPIEDDPARDWTVDCWTMRTGSSSYAVKTMLVEYSDDMEHWTEAGKITRSFYNNWQTLSFEAVKKKYWRFTMEAQNTVPANGLHLQMYARRTGQPIRFTTAPPQGAVITMNATIDRPLKNDKHALDFNPVVQW